MTISKVYEIKKAPRNEGALRIAQAILETAKDPSTTEILAFIKNDEGFFSVSTDLSNMPELLAILEMAKYDCLRKMTQ